MKRDPIAPLDSQVPTCPLNRGNSTWRTYTAVDGLAGLLVEHIAEDSEGYLWFATATGGASRFDGDEFCTFTTREGLCGDQVYAIHQDQQGRLWFGTWDGGVCWYDGRSFHYFAEKSGVSNRSVTHLFEDREGSIWFGGADALGYCDVTGFHDLTPAYRRRYPQAPRTCWGIAQDDGGRIWFGLRENLVYYDGSDFQSPDDLPLCGEGVYSVARNSQGGLWVGHREKIWHYEGKTFRPVPVEIKGYIRKIQHDREGRTWFCLSGGGVLCYDGGEFHHFTTQDGLARDDINAVFQDHEGQYWFATWGGGVSACDPSSVHVFGGLLPHKEAFALKEDRRGVIWVGFSDLFPPSSTAPKGVCYGDGENFAVLDLGEGLDTLVIHEDGGGHLWFGGFQGLRCYDGRTTRKIGLEEGFGGIMVSAIAEDEKGRLFFGHCDSTGSEVRLTRYDGQHFATLFSEERKDAFFSINAIIASRSGDLWFALGGWKGQGVGKGIGRVDDAGRITFYTVEDGLVDSRVEDLVEDRHHRLWVATWGGISCFDGAKFQNFTTEEGLPNNHVQCICEDRQGHLWFGTEGGAVHYDGRLFQYIRSPEIIYVTEIIEDRTGRLWFATLNGAVRYTLSCTPPRVRVLQVITDQVYQAVEKVEIPTSVQQIICEYKGMSLRTHSRDMLYTYRLQGYDKGWQPATRTQRAFYRGLPPGEYLFLVQAVDRDLNYSEPATVKFIVEPDPRIEALTEALSAVTGQFVGRSPALQHVQAHLAQVAPTDLTVLILGETGTGKGLAARTVHQLSQRRSGPFLQVNCGGIPSGLLESELFGHERGAFTGAVARKLGKVELADGGTLFLDEIGDLPVEGQAKLLRLLEERTFERVGGTRTLSAQVRVIAATNRDLAGMVAAGQFRQDLYFRLQGFTVWLPPLRQRREDIPELALFFAGRMAAHLDKRIQGFEPAALALLEDYPWPGNVRELEHAVQRGVIVVAGPHLRAADLALPVVLPVEGPLEELGLPPEEYERRYLGRVLAQTGWVIKGAQGAAARLGISPSTLHSRLKKLGIARPEGR